MKFFYLLLISTTLCSCEKEAYFRTSGEPLTYEDVKNTSYLPAYIKYDIIFATTITITPANGDTLDYWKTDFGYYQWNNNSTNYIKEIDINGIKWKGSSQDILNYSNTINRDSSRFSIVYTSDYDLVNVNSGFQHWNGYAYFRVNRANDNCKLFEAHRLSDYPYDIPIYQQKPTNTEKEYQYAINPSVCVKNVWGITDLTALGKMINAIARKSADTTITYYNRW